MSTEDFLNKLFGKQSVKISVVGLQVSRLATGFNMVGLICVIQTWYPFTFGETLSVAILASLTSMVLGRFVEKKHKPVVLDHTQEKKNHSHLVDTKNKK